MKCAGKWQPSDAVDVLLLSAGWGPYAYFRMLEESRGMTQVHNAQNGSQAQLTEVHVEDREEQSHHGCMGLTIPRNQNPTLDEIESGRR